jgi:polar amino acid transport system permease protein
MSQSKITARLANIPYWLLFILLGGVVLAFQFVTNSTYADVFRTIIGGVFVTLQVTLFAYASALVIGLLTGMGQLSKNTLIRNLAMTYVQVIRGVPILVQIFYVALVITPGTVSIINALGRLFSPENALTQLSIRDISFTLRGIFALAISYGAFSAEIFRAGIQSIEQGQTEAAAALGLSRWQALRLVVLPQAIRRVLPPLGNDFISMLKESSLVGILGVDEITGLGRKYASTSFRYPETYNTLAFLYLSMTLLLSLLVRTLEKHLNPARR